MKGVFSKKRYRKGAIIASEGSLSQIWFILISGKVAVFKHRVRIEEFSVPGTLFGELSAILGQPRTATLRALEPSEVMCLDASIEEIIKVHPEIALKLITTLAQRLARTTEWLSSELDEEFF